MTRRHRRANAVGSCRNSRRDDGHRENTFFGGDSGHGIGIVFVSHDNRDNRGFGIQGVESAFFKS